MGVGLDRELERERELDRERTGKNLPRFLITVQFLVLVYGWACQHFWSLGSKRHFYILTINIPFFGLSVFELLCNEERLLRLHSP